MLFYKGTGNIYKVTPKIYHDLRNRRKRFLKKDKFNHVIDEEPNFCKILVLDDKVRFYNTFIYKHIRYKGSKAHMDLNNDYEKKGFIENIMSFKIERLEKFSVPFDIDYMKKALQDGFLFNLLIFDLITPLPNNSINE